MTKTVFSNDMLAHVWAQNNQAAGRSNNGNFYFKGPTLYSYGSHFVVGHHLPDGPTLLNTEGYSISTSGHRGDARQAVRGRDVIHVPQLTRLVGNIRYTRTAKAMRPAIRAYCIEQSKADSLCDDSLRALLAYVGLSQSFDKIRANAARAVRIEKAAALKKHKATALATLKACQISATEMRVNLANELQRRNYGSAADIVADVMKPIRSAQRVLGKAGTPTRIWQASQTALKLMAEMVSELERGRGPATKRATIRNHISQYRRALSSVAHHWESMTAARPGEKSSSLYQMRESLSRVQGALAYIGNHESGGIPQRLRSKALEATHILQGPLDAMRAAYHALQAAERLERERLQALSEAESRANWFAGLASQWRGQKETGAAYIRATGIERDSAGMITAGTLETSQGATVPLVAAIRAFRFVKLVKERGEPWHRNGQTLPVGHFQIDRIETSGNFRAGCHAIDWLEIQALADELGVAGLAANAEAVTHGNV